MNDKPSNNLVSQNPKKDNSEEVLVKEVAVATNNTSALDGSQISPRSTYDSFYWSLSYTKMFVYRFAKDLFITLLGYVYSGQLLPNHIVDLMNVQNNLRRENEPHTVTCSSSRKQQNSTLQLSMSKYFNAIKTYILCSEDDFALQCTPTRDNSVDKKPMFIIVESTCLSNPSYRETLIDTKPKTRDTIMKKYFRNPYQSIYPPQTNIDMEVDDINNESIVISYLSDEDLALDFEELSETSLDARIPSFPGSPRSLHFGSEISLATVGATDPKLIKAVNFLHQDTDFLMAAEIGDVRLLEILISKEVNKHQIDHLGRNALHLAVSSNNENAVLVLLKAGINPNIKDNLGMTPLSLCLMRRPSLYVVKMLFDYGAKILPRSCPMDTGLFLQFVMMCTPTEEEERILRFLVEQGALITDAEAPGGRQALHFAAMSNNCELINILMDLGADLLVTNHRNETAKEVALTFKCKEALALLEQLEEKYVNRSNNIAPNGSTI